MKKSILIPLLILILLMAVIGIIYTTYFPLKYSDIVDKYCKIYNLSPSLVYSTINVESGFNPNTVSKAQAIGLMQILPTTAEDIASRLEIAEYDLYSPETNIQFGCYYLRYLIDMYSGDIDTAIVAYNAGLGTVNEWRNQNILPDNIPFKETRDYIKKIKFNQRMYSTKLN